MGLIYVPVENISNYSCYTVYDSQTIRAYYNTPIIGENNYTDFFVNSHYLESDGVQTISSTTEFPLCINSEKLTNQYSYRNDFAHIIVISSFFLFFIFLALKLLGRIMGKYGKL